MISKTIGWLGFSFGIVISIPQIIKIIQTKSVEGISRLTYILLICACLCYTIRSIAIRELIFVVSNSFQISISLVILFLINKYQK